MGVTEEEEVEMVQVITEAHAEADWVEEEGVEEEFLCEEGSEEGSEEASAVPASLGDKGKALLLSPVLWMQMLCREFHWKFVVMIIFGEHLLKGLLTAGGTGGLLYYGESL